MKNVKVGKDGMTIKCPCCEAEIRFAPEDERVFCPTPECGNSKNGIPVAEIVKADDADLPRS